MPVGSTMGSKFYISLTPADPYAFRNITDEQAWVLFDAINDWVEVEEVEDLGEIGDTAETATFSAVSSGRVYKEKSTRNAGTHTVPVGFDPLDDGQVALSQAQETKFNYHFKVVDPARAANQSSTLKCYIGLVIGDPINMGAANNIQRQTFTMEVNSKVFIKRAEIIGS